MAEYYRKNNQAIKSIEFSSKELMLDYARKLIKRKFNYNVDYLLSSSMLLKNIKHQNDLLPKP